MRSRSLFIGPGFHRYAFLLARLIVGGVLMYAGFSKAINPVAEFAAAIDVYRIIPTPWVTTVATIIPWIEFYTGVFILFGFFGRLGAAFSTMFFTVFLTVFVTSIFRGIHLESCGCFGSGLSLTLPQAISFDLLLFILSAYLVIKPLKFFSVDDWVSRE